MAFGTPGRPFSEPRSPYKVRQAQRRAFQLLKQQVDSSPETLARRRKDADRFVRFRARKKLKAMLRGDSESPWTLDQLRRLNPAEISLIVGYSKARLDSLTPEQVARFKLNAGIFVTAWMTDQMFRDLVEYELP